MAEEFLIRLAAIEDIKDVFDLSNDDVVRKNSINQEKIKWEDHIQWFNRKIADKNSIFYVACENNNFVGYCRLDKNEKDEWVVTIHLDSNFRNKGYGKRLLNYVCINNKEKEIVAFVKITNSHSLQTFKKSNFTEVKEILLNNVKCMQFKYEQPKFVIAISNDLYNSTQIFSKKEITFINKKENLNYEFLNSIKPKYVFFPHWSYIIPSQIYENFNCIIFHMTDLPFGRGGSPLQNLIEREITTTKISAIKCIKEIDAGDIYLKKELDISYGNAQEIYHRAGEIISKMIDEIIEKDPEPKPQIGEIIEFKRRKPEQSNIKDLNNIKKIYDYIRMLDAAGYPKAFLENGNIKFEFSNAKFENNKIIANVEIKVKNYD